MLLLKVNKFWGLGFLFWILNFRFVLTKIKKLFAMKKSFNLAIGLLIAIFSIFLTQVNAQSTAMIAVGEAVFNVTAPPELINLMKLPGNKLIVGYEKSLLNQSSKGSERKVKTFESMQDAIVVAEEQFSSLLSDSTQKFVLKVEDKILLVYVENGEFFIKLQKSLKDGLYVLVEPK
jgi:hypothetical protein